MQCVSDISDSVYEPAGTKRAASGAPSCATSYTPQHDFPCLIGQTCFCKRQRVFNRYPSLNTQYPPSVFTGDSPPIRHEIRNPDFKVAEKKDKSDYATLYPKSEAPILMRKTATPFASKQGGNFDSELTVPVSQPLNQLQRKPLNKPRNINMFNSNRTKAIESYFTTDKGPAGPHQGNIDQCSIGNTKIHNFFTKASILSPKGILELERVQVDNRSFFNLLPSSIAVDLGLNLYFGDTLTITIADSIVQTNQYCQFIIRVADVDKKINSGVIYGLQTVLLGQEWVQSVGLLSGLGDQSYYIPIPLIVQAAEEKFSNFGYTSIKAQNTEGFDGNEPGTAFYNNSLRDEWLPSGKFPSTVELPLDDDISSSKLSLDDGEISSEELNLDEYELELTDDDDYDKDNSDYGDYEDEEGKGHEERADDITSNLQDFGKQQESFEISAEAHWTKASHEPADMDPEKRLQYLAYLACLKDSVDRNNDSVKDLALNMGGQQSEAEDEHGLPSFHHGDSPKHFTAPSLARSPADGVQTLITKPQIQGILNTLNQIVWTQAGQNFRAPVERLWPECADVYNDKVPNPIDLGTMEAKMKSNMYHSLNDFRADAILLYENSLAFNGIDHIITSAALEVRDDLLKVIDDMEEGKGSTILRASARK